MNPNGRRSNRGLPPHDLDLDPVGLRAAWPDRPDFGVCPAALGHGLECQAHPPPPRAFDQARIDRCDFSQGNSLDGRGRAMSIPRPHSLSAQDEHACGRGVLSALEFERDRVCQVARQGRGHGQARRVADGTLRVPAPGTLPARRRLLPRARVEWPGRSAHRGSSRAAVVIAVELQRKGRTPG